MGEVRIAGRDFKLFHPDDHERVLIRLKEEHGNKLIVVDFTHPSVVNRNAELYCKLGIPFVMGTTGGDRDKLIQTVVESENLAVIAPNMAKQIVGFTAMMEFAAENFPGLFEEYGLEIRESHQAGKADTSGTAKAMVRYFNAMGAPFCEDHIQKIRDPDEQRDIGVPEKYLDGHGWHAYTLLSGDETVKFMFTHNVNGRDVYAQGTMDAVLFLAEMIEEGVEGHVFSMIDVLRGVKTTIKRRLGRR